MHAEDKDRFLRAGQLAQFLVGNGHDVTWWTAQFYHQKKTFRDITPDQRIHLGAEAPKMVFLKSCGYDNNLSLKRLLDHALMGRGFARIAPTLEAPDIIFCAYPTVELSLQAVKFGKERNIPVILDIRDLWPDVIYERIQDKLNIPVTGLLVPYERMACQAFQSARGVTALTHGMLEWGQDRFHRSEELQINDRVFSQSKPPFKPSGLSEQQEIALWKARGVDLNAPKTRFVWVGNIVPDTDGDTLLNAISAIPDHDAKNIEIIICGLGSMTDLVKNLAQKHSHLIYAGWVGEPDLPILLKRSQVGLLCYLDRPDFRMSIPNKVVDYCFGGMRILTNLHGALQKLPGSEEFVTTYPTGDSAALAQIMCDIAQTRPTSDLKASRAVFERFFDATKIMPEMEKYMVNLVNEARAAPSEITT